MLNNASKGIKKDKSYYFCIGEPCEKELYVDMS
jgi:hypothetical protein